MPQVGTYDHVVFSDHAVTLHVENYAGCDGQVSGEFIRGISITGTSHAWVAACDGIYSRETGDLVAPASLKFETDCVSFVVVLTNGYLNLHTVTTSCELQGGVYKVR